MASGGRDHPQGQMSQIQRQIQQDWANREYIELMTCSIKKITDFLNAFGMYEYGRKGAAFGCEFPCVRIEYGP